METSTALAAYDVLRFAESFLERLERCVDLVSESPDLEAERGWAETARGRVREIYASVPEVLTRARDLPELAEVRGDFVLELQSRWVDAVERLQAGITFHVGSRTPVLEALFPNVRLSTLRRGARSAVESYGRELDRRLRSAYLTRMLATRDFAFAPPVIEQLRHAFDAWLTCLDAVPLPAVDAEDAGRALVRTAETLELRITQARLLAQASLVGRTGQFDELGLGSKPRRRSAAAAEDGTVPVPPVEEEPEPDPIPEPVPEPVAEALLVEELPPIAEPPPLEALPTVEAIAAPPTVRRGRGRGMTRA